MARRPPPDDEMMGFLKRFIEDENGKLDRRFSNIVSVGGWRLLKRGERFNPRDVPETAVVGVTAWDTLGTQALAALAERSEKAKRNVVIFDLDNCSTVAELEAFLPGVSVVWQTPVVAEYCEGKLVCKLEGKEARDWMTRKANENT